MSGQSCIVTIVLLSQLSHTRGIRGNCSSISQFDYSVKRCSMPLRHSVPLTQSVSSVRNTKSSTSIQSVAVYDKSKPGLNEGKAADNQQLSGFKKKRLQPATF